MSAFSDALRHQYLNLPKSLNQGQTVAWSHIENWGAWEALVEAQKVEGCLGSGVLMNSWSDTVWWEWYCTGIYSFAAL